MFDSLSLAGSGVRVDDFNTGLYRRFVGVYSGQRKDGAGSRTQISEVWGSTIIDKI